MLESVFCKAGGLKGCNFIKKRLQHRFFPRICEVFKNSFSYRTSPIAASASLGVLFLNLLFAEAATRGCSVKKIFSIISQDSQENTCAIVSFLKKRLWHWCFPVNLGKSLSTSFLCTTPVAASVFGFNGFHGIKDYYCNFIKKETLAQVFSCEFCETSKNTFFTEHLWTTVSIRSKNILKMQSLF